MCSWGHVAINSTACSHEWRAHSTIALVFSTETWHEQKKKKVIFWPWPQMSGWGTNATPTRLVGRVNCEPNLRLRPHLDQPTEASSSVWTLAGKCHMETAERVSWHPRVLSVAQRIHAPLPWSLHLPCLSRVTALPLWHKSSIWFHLTGAMNNLIEGALLFPASSTSLAITSSLGSAISVAWLSGWTWREDVILPRWHFILVWVCKYLVEWVLKCYFFWYTTSTCCLDVCRFQMWVG